MHSLDFLSQSPHLFIFRRSSNKTNLGGILFFIQIILCLTIFLYYLLDYTKNNKYEIEYTFNYNLPDNYEIEDMLKNDTFNPTLDHWVYLINSTTGEYLNDNFVIFNKKYGISARQIYHFQEKASEIDILIYYKCNELNCSLRKEDKQSSYKIRFSHSPYIISHQDENSPISQNLDIGNAMDFEFSFDVKIKKNLEWQIIKYIEKGGLFSEGKEYIAGSIKSGDIFIYDEPYIWWELDSLDTYVLLYEIKVHNKFEYYDEYIRTKISWLTIFSNSLSLWLSLYNGFTVAFSFLYADNFNNYKIIQNILSKVNKVEPKNKNNIELSSDFNKNEKLINNQNTEKEIVIKDEFNERDNINEKSNDFQYEASEDNSLELPKLRMFDYIFNNIYCTKKCCFNYKRQMLISTSNDILGKYFSIENILYNQIMIENIIKDYKWNNHRLKSIQNNELISKLKNYLYDT
jgi:hypothetical protein